MSLIKDISLKQWVILLTMAFVIAVFSDRLFITFAQIPVNTDIPAHSNLAIDAASNWTHYPANFGLYLSSNILAPIMPKLGEITPTYRALSVIIAVAVGFKFIISTLIIRALIVWRQEKKRFVISAILGLVSIFVFAIPYRYLGGESFYYYYGSFVPNVWHNSTIIASMPFTLLLFWWSAKEIEKPERRRVWALSTIAVLLVCIKPSFIFIYCSAFSILFFIRYRFQVRYIIHYAPVAASVLIVIAQWYFIYISETNTLGQSSVIFSPLGHWKSWTTGNSLILAIAASALAPFIAIFGTRNPNDWKSYYAATLFIIGLVIYLLIAESGERFVSGNFYWQVVPSTFILFAMALGKLAESYLHYSQTSLRQKICMYIAAIGIFAHLVFGLLYFSHIFEIKNFC